MALRKPDTLIQQANGYKHHMVNFAPPGYLSGRSTSFLNEKTHDISNQSIVVKRKPLYVKVFVNVLATDKDIHAAYALVLISEAVSLKKNYPVMKQNGKDTQTIKGTDRVYYAYRGKSLIGQCSIRDKRTFRGTQIIYIFTYKLRISVRKNSRFVKKRTPKKMMFKGAK
ncbi:hypothetical protein [Staphylococcus phage vB_SauH_DELF3]|nr:hypothetical protein [Staphylococcus phage vB_SauH_DELF3]